MAKKNKYKEPIKKILFKESLNFKELNYAVRKELGMKNIKFTNKNYLETLINLLKDDEIRIAGYDYAVHDVKDERIQSFEREGIIFSLVKKEESDIYLLLNQLENLDYKEVNAKEELKACFERKYAQYERKELNLYNSLLSRVKSYSAIKEYNKEVKYVNENAQAEYEAKKFQLDGNIHPKTKVGEEWKCFPEFGEHRKKLLRVMNYFHSSELTENSKVWRIQDLTRDEAWKITIQKYSRNRNIYQSTIWEMKENTLKDLGYEMWKTKMEWVDVEGDGDGESYLNRFQFLPERSLEDIFELFNMILFFINTHENYKSLKHHFAFALSDEIGSMYWFEHFLNYVIVEPFHLKFQKELGVKEPKYII